MRADDSAERYRSLEKVGEGAFGVVTRAIERETGREVALKRVRVPDLSTLPIPALREMLALRRVEHPNVVPLLSRYTHGANIVLVFPFLPGSLAGLLAAQSAPLPEPEAAALAYELLAGLCACHAHGIVHRDIKPANLLLCANGRLCIGDFGQSRLLPPDLDASLSHAVATRWYRAPELLFGARRYADASTPSQDHASHSCSRSASSAFAGTARRSTYGLRASCSRSSSA